MVYYFPTKCFIFLLTVIFVEDEVLSMSDATATKEIRAEHTLITVDEVFIVVPGFITEEHI